MELQYGDKKSVLEILENTPTAKLDLQSKGHNLFSDWSNLLIDGDNLSALKALYLDRDMRGKIRLIYIDPPFATEREFSDRENNHAYSDALNGHEYVEFLRQRLVFLKELLSPDGSIYVHLDQKKGHYIKIILDEIFGEFNFVNEITRIKCNPKNFDRKAYGNMKDTIYFYSNNPNSQIDLTCWNELRISLEQKEITGRFNRLDKTGRRYTTTPLHAPGETINGATGQPWKNMLPPKGRHWRYPPQELTRLDNVGLVEWSKTGNPRKIIYADEGTGKKIQDIWEFKDAGAQNASYPTEKNIEMLKRIIQVSSNKGDIVLDCFAGSGTTLVAAEMLGRRWIGIDNSPMAIRIIRNRLDNTADCAPYRFLKATIDDAASKLKLSNKVLQE
ncbi:MAG: site-specific DNA-methyltransferase [Candidatus Micrarchaeia archaeon]